MFLRSELDLVCSLRDEYKILICNAHDIRLLSRMTGHEWIIISPYDKRCCEVLHRHSGKDPFHYQGKYRLLTSAIGYIQKHDTWYSRRHALRIQKGGC